MTRAHPPLPDFTTARLRVRHWAATLASTVSRDRLLADLAPLLTPEVLAALPPSLHLDAGADAVSRWLEDRAAESDGYLVETVADGRLVGLMILARPDHAAAEAEIHLGYLFAASAWGRGHATELVRGAVGAARARAPLTLLGGVATDNPASARVLEKSGFTRRADLSAPDTDVFSIAIPARR